MVSRVTSWVSSSMIALHVTETSLTRCLIVVAGVAAYYSAPMFANIGDKYSAEWASTILAILAALVCIPV